MRKRLMATLVILAFATSLVSVLALAGEGEDPAMMDAWMKSMQPGPHHANLAGMVGEWTSTMTMWETPTSEPVVTKGTTTYKTIMDGRFLLQKSEGTVMGMPHHGMGITGYDNIKGKHVVVWLDNMGTGILYAEGECEDHCKMITQYAEIPDPMGHTGKYKMVSRVVNDNEHVFEWYMVSDGKEIKQMEIVYSRAEEAKG